MRVLTILALSALAVGAAAPASADVQLQIQNGRVTLVAKDATVRQILTEWARVGQTKIVNLERIPGAPLTLELRDVSEQQALKVLLRSLSGYITAPREIASANASLFDRIIVMPTVARPPSPSSSAPPPTFTAFQPPQQQVPDDERDEQPRAPVGGVPAPAAAGNRGPVFVFPTQPGAPSPAAAATPAAAAQAPASSFPGAPTTTAPIGVARPGMIAPGPPTQPGQPVPPPPPPAREP